MCEQGNAAETINIYVNDASNNTQLLSAQAIGAYETFVWNDKFVMIGGDKLVVNCGSAANVDFLCTYIDQDWS
jgi:dTDP-glucose pyrophosphorylase